VIVPGGSRYDKQTGSSKEMSEHIKTTIDEKGIATVLIDRNERRNAMTYEMLGAFIEACKQLGENPDVKVVILTGGAEGSFCAGIDLADLSSVPGSERNLRGRAEERGKWWPLVECPKPIVCAIDGPAVGMGAEFTSLCDVRIASTRARFAWNFVHRGLVPDTGAGTWLLPRLIGTSKALQLLYSGAFLSAEEALGIGYVSRVVETDDLMAAAQAEAESFLAGSPYAIAKIKSLVYEGLERSIGEHMQVNTADLADCFASNDHAEGVASFLEKRAPNFTGT